jgi:hypothetical protein
MAKIRITLEAEIDSPAYAAEKAEDFPVLQENLWQLCWDSMLYQRMMHVKMLIQYQKLIEEAGDDRKRVTELQEQKRQHIWHLEDSARVMEQLCHGIKVEILEPGPPRPLDFEEFSYSKDKD